MSYAPFVDINQCSLKQCSPGFLVEILSSGSGRRRYRAEWNKMIRNYVVAVGGVVWVTRVQDIAVQRDTIPSCLSNSNSIFEVLLVFKEEM